MRMVERLIQRILGKGRIWWPRPVELARFWLAREQAGPREQGARA